MVTVARNVKGTGRDYADEGFALQDLKNQVRDFEKAYGEKFCLIDHSGVRGDPPVGEQVEAWPTMKSAALM